MSHTTPAGAVTTVPVAESAAAALDVASSLRRPGRLRDERGMNTVEYAIGIVLVLVTIDPPTQARRIGRVGRAGGREHRRHGPSQPRPHPAHQPSPGVPEPSPNLASQTGRRPETVIGSGSLPT